MKKILEKLNLLETGLPTNKLRNIFFTLFSMLFVFFIQTSCSKKEVSKSELALNKELNYSFKKLQKEFSDNLLLEAIYHIDKKNELKLFNVSTEVDYMLFDSMIQQVLLNDCGIVDSLLFILQSQFNYPLYFIELNNWCEDFLLLEIPSKMNQPHIFLEEVIYEIPMTNHIILSFLNNEQQDWSSLSETQIYELPYRVCLYLSTLSSKERMYFYSIFFETILNKLNSNYIQ